MSAWLGGSILASVSGFHEMWMSKAVRAASSSCVDAPTFFHLMVVNNTNGSAAAVGRNTLSTDPVWSTVSAHKLKTHEAENYRE